MSLVEEKILEAINTFPTPSLHDIEEVMNLNKRTIQNRITKLVKEGKIAKHRRLDDAR